MEDVMEDDQTDSWAMTLQKFNAEREKEQEREIALSGRGARRKAADIAKVISVTSVPVKGCLPYVQTKIIF